MPFSATDVRVRGPVVGNGPSQNKLPVLMISVVVLLHGLTYLYAALLYTKAGFMQTHGFPLLKGQLSLSVTSASAFPVKSTCCGKVKGGLYKVPNCGRTTIPLPVVPQELLCS